MLSVVSAVQLLRLALLAQGAQTGVPSEKACLELAQRIEAAINSEDPASIDGNLDFRSMVLKGLQSANAPKDLRDEISADATFGKSISWGKTIHRAIAGKGSYKLLRLRVQQGVPRALFRMIADSAVNYHDYEFAVAESGGVRIADVYIALSAEWMSETLRRLTVAALSGGGKKLSGPSEAYIKGLLRIPEMAKANQEGKPQEVLKIFASLPREVQKEKNAHLLRIGAAAQVGEKEALLALEEFKKAYPGDPCLDFVSIDPLTTIKKFDLVLAAIERVDARLGGDAYLDFLRCSVYLMMEDSAKAKECAQRSTEREATLDKPYWVLITLSMKEKNWAETAKWLTAIEKNAGIGIGDLTTVDAYAGFVKSSEYKEWLESRGKK